MENDEYFIHEAEACIGKREYEKAIEFAEHIANDERHQLQFNTIMGIAYYHLDEFEKCIQHLEKAIELDPDHYALYDMLTAAYGLSDQHEKAIEKLNYIISKEPFNADYLYKRGYAFLTHNEFDKALTDLSNAENINHLVHPELNFFLGVCNYNLKDYMAASDYFEKQLALNPDHTESLFLRGNCHYELGEYVRCITDMSKVLWLDEKHEAALFRRFLAKKDNGNYEGAENDLRKLLFEINPNYVSLTDKDGKRLQIKGVNVDRNNGDVNFEV